jgi:hypothetical protein
VLAEDFRRQVESVPASQRLPALELIFSRGTPCAVGAATPNHLRFTLFGSESKGALPVASLTHVSDRKDELQNEYYWVRADPVTLRADMARVFMINHGFADLDAHEREEIGSCIRNVLLEEGIQLHADHPERWCIALDSPLTFEFKPLEEALGMDLAEALPGDPQARLWRRLLNEIQVALHHCPVNIRRRNSGKQEINSVWFWGGGFIPQAARHELFGTVYSDSPVTRGLAIINDCRLKSQGNAKQDEFGLDGESILIDWTARQREPREELITLDSLVGRLLKQVDKRALTLTLFDGSGEGRRFDHRSKRRFWRRLLPLSINAGTRPGA